MESKSRNKVICVCVIGLVSIVLFATVLAVAVVAASRNNGSTTTADIPYSESNEPGYNENPFAGNESYGEITTLNPLFVSMDGTEINSSHPSVGGKDLKTVQDVMYVNESGDTVLTVLYVTSGGKQIGVRMAKMDAKCGADLSFVLNSTSISGGCRATASFGEKAPMVFNLTYIGVSGLRDSCRIKIMSSSEYRCPFGSRREIPAIKIESINDCEIPDSKCTTDSTEGGQTLDFNLAVEDNTSIVTICSVGFTMGDIYKCIPL